MWVEVLGKYLKHTFSHFFLNWCFPSPVTDAGEFQDKTFPKVEVNVNSCCAIRNIQTQMMFVFVFFSLQLNRSRGQCFLQEVNTITTAASCCCAGAQEAQSVGEVGAGGRMREADRTGQRRDDNDKLPWIYSNCVTWSFDCYNVCFQSLTLLMSEQ